MSAFGMVTVPLGRSAPGTPIHEAAEEAVAALRLLRAAYPGVYRVTFEHGGQHLTAEHGVHTPESLVAIYQQATRPNPYPDGHDHPAFIECEPTCRAFNEEFWATARPCQEPDHHHPEQRRPQMLTQSAYVGRHRAE